MVGLEAMQFEELPLGFRFKPTDVELIDHYLRLKINGHENQVSCIKEVDICKVEPWDLPDLSAIKTNDCEWFYFCPRDRKYPNGQRLNRATDAGYWKATGKDRTIKSRKLGSIGMKKTLVFYTGRAPKGQRSNWVIHEYRTTLKELDGSQPGQGAFVLCRLFKKADELKQDVNDEVSHTDEVETNICSPNPTNISHEDIQSGPAVQASPVSVEQSVEQKIIFENCVVKTSISLTSETIFPDHPRMNEEMTPEVDSHFTGGIKSYEDSSDLFMKWQDGPVGMAEIFPPVIGDGYNGSKLQDISGGRDTISDFLDSVFMNPYAPIGKEAGLQGNPIIESDIWNHSSIKESGSCSGSDVEAGQQQCGVDYVYHTSCDKNSNATKGNMGLLQSNLLVNDDEIFSDAALDLFCKQESVCYKPPLPGSFLEVEDGTRIVGNNGIKIRPHIRSRQVPSANSILQGTAERRIRFAMIKNSKPTVSEEPTIPPYKDVICLEDLAENMIKLDEYESSVGSTREAETEIKISTNLQRSQPSASKLVKHGITRRRILLEKVTAAYNGGDVTKPPILAERRNLTEEFSDDETDCSPDIKPITFKKPTSLMQMVKVVTVLFLFMACFGLWIARNVCFLSS